MINGAHIVIYSKDAEADRAVFRDVLGFDHVDVGHGWLIFTLPPAELAVHPSDENDKHKLFLMCDDVEGAVKTLKAKGIACEPFSTQGWGKSTRLALPGGGGLGLYEPRHAARA
jgi:catechol 2,3-dioxygenase-like lactoylglutathione lyase family enzyme